MILSEGKPYITGGPILGCSIRRRQSLPRPEIARRGAAISSDCHHARLHPTQVSRHEIDALTAKKAKGGCDVETSVFAPGNRHPLAAQGGKVNIAMENHVNLMFAHENFPSLGVSQ